MLEDVERVFKIPVWSNHQLTNIVYKNEYLLLSQGKTFISDNKEEEKVTRKNYK
jgi:hypothetical protein